MTSADFEAKRHELSVMAGMNQRYHQIQVRKYWWRDATAKIVTAVFAILSLSLSIVTAFDVGTLLVGTGIAVSLVAAIAAIVLNVVPFGSWEKEHADCFRRWTDLREDIDSLAFQAREQPTAEVIERLRQIDAKVHRICGSESLADEKLLTQCLHAEERSRGLDDASVVPAQR